MGDYTSDGATALHDFQALPSSKHLERMERLKNERGALGIALSELWLGIAAQDHDDGSIDIGFACNDGTYTMDFSVHTLRTDKGNLQVDDKECGSAASGDNERGAVIADYLVCAIRKYEERNKYKFLGAGLSQNIARLCPQASSRLWADLDIVPIIVREEEGGSLKTNADRHSSLGVDEFADSMARKCVMWFGPSHNPRVQVGRDNIVEVDVAGRAPLASLEQYRKTVSEQTWNTTMKYAKSLKEKKTKIAFFSATPQGGGVALMRHAVIRVYLLLGLDVTWWVPRPKPEVFRITKTNHNILQGVAKPDQRLSKDQQKILNEWVQTNAERFWTKAGGPLSPRSQGGADFIIVDDPQLPGLVEISKKLDPNRPVVFRSHIQIRSDLAKQAGSPTAEVWEWLWSSAKHADLFISHPVSDFVPQDVRKQALGYMPATTDWLDGLNKELSDFDTAYYLHEFNTECQRQRMTNLDFPQRQYIIQVARFDPSKGIPDVLAAYAEFRRNSEYCKGKPAEKTPMLVICGHFSVDDPDGTIILDETLEMLDNEYSDIKDSVVAMRLGPTDQLLNALLSNAHVALQLSTREGFEVKVSEALHKGVPVIATNAGGIPLQIEHEKSGFLVDPEPKEQEKVNVAKYLNVLFTDNKRYEAMSKYAAAHVSDEVSTFGNGTCWLYLADQMAPADKANDAKGGKVEPNGRMIWDMAREAAGEPIREDEVALPRTV